MPHTCYLLVYPCLSGYVTSLLSCSPISDSPSHDPLTSVCSDSDFLLLVPCLLQYVWLIILLPPRRWGASQSITHSCSGWRTFTTREYEDPCMYVYVHTGYTDTRAHTPSVNDLILVQVHHQISYKTTSDFQSISDFSTGIGRGLHFSPLTEGVVS